MKKYIPHAIIGILMVAVVFQCTESYSDSSIRNDLKKQNEHLQSQNDRLLDSTEVLQLSNVMLQEKIDSLDLQITNYKTEILIIKTKANEKVNSIDRFNVSDLQRFFSERYK